MTDKTTSITAGLRILFDGVVQNAASPLCLRLRQYLEPLPEQQRPVVLAGLVTHLLLNLPMRYQEATTQLILDSIRSAVLAYTPEHPATDPVSTSPHARARRRGGRVAFVTK